MIDHHLVNLAKFSKVVRLLQNLWISQPRRESNNKNQVLLHNPHIRQVFPVLCYLLFLCLNLLSSISLEKIIILFLLIFKWMTIHKVSSLLISEVCELLIFILVSFNSRVKTNLHSSPWSWPPSPCWEVWSQLGSQSMAVCRRDTIHSPLSSACSSRTDRSGIHRCRGRSWCRPARTTPCREDTLEPHHHSGSTQTWLLCL